MAEDTADPQAYPPLTLELSLALLLPDFFLPNTDAEYLKLGAYRTHSTDAIALIPSFNYSLYTNDAKPSLQSTSLS